MIHRIALGRTYRGSVQVDNKSPRKPRPSIDAKQLAFNSLLSEGFKAINENKPWLHLFLRCPITQWATLYRTLNAAQKDHDTFSPHH